MRITGNNGVSGPGNEALQAARFDRGGAPLRLAAGLLALVLSGCATIDPGGGEPGPAVQVTGAEPAPGRSGPTPSFSEDVLYRLLVGEIAGRRGQLSLSLDHYLAAARETRDPGIAERAVRIAVFSRDEEGGLEAARLWTEIAPESADAKQVYATLLVRAGRTDQAVERLQEIIGMQADTATGYAAVGDMLAREKNKETATEIMERLVAQEPDNPAALFPFAQLLARAGKFDRSLEVLRRLIEMNPDNERVVMFHARLVQRQGNTTEALASLERYLQRTPEAASVRLTFARLLVDAKRYDEARSQFERLSSDDPDNVDVRYALGLLLVQTNHLDSAAEQFRILVNQGERVHAAWYYLGQIAESKQDTEAALDAYRRVRGGEHRLSAQVRVAVLTAETGDIGAARAHLHALHGDTARDAVRLYRAEAEILARHDMLDEALQVYNAALEEYPRNSDLLYSRAMLAEKLDRLDLLEQDLRTILIADPNNADALNALGYTLADRTDRYEEALELIERAYSLKPDDHYIVDSLGWVMYRMGRYQEALEHLRRAMELNGDPEIAAHLGEVLWVMGEKRAAQEVWDSALESTPDDQRLLDVKKRFGL